MLPANAAEGLADRRMFGIQWMAGYPAGASDRSDAATQCRKCIAFAGSREICTDDLWRCWHRIESVPVTPGLVVREVGRIGPQRCRRVRSILVGLRLASAIAARGAGGFAPPRRASWRLRASVNELAMTPCSMG